MTVKPYSIFSELMPSSVMLMLPAPPFIHHRSLQHVMQKSQNSASCLPGKLAEFKSSSIFGPSGDEGTAGKPGHLEWQLQPVP
jgi:hypothetical protein